jgi:hypothetical protein
MPNVKHARDTHLSMIVGPSLKMLFTLEGQPDSKSSAELLRSSCQIRYLTLLSVPLGTDKIDGVDL